jgi:hypothetical protein
MPKMVVEELTCWEGRFSHDNSSRIWNAVLLCFRWTIWGDCIVGLLMVYNFFFLFFFSFLMNDTPTGFF